MEARRQPRRHSCVRVVLTLVSVAGALSGAGFADSGQTRDERVAEAAESRPLEGFDCGLRPHEEWLAALEVARAEGQVPSAAELARANPARLPEGSAAGSVLTTCLSSNMVSRMRTPTRC